MSARTLARARNTLVLLALVAAVATLAAVLASVSVVACGGCLVVVACALAGALALDDARGLR